MIKKTEDLEIGDLLQLRGKLFLLKNFEIQNRKDDMPKAITLYLENHLPMTAFIGEIWSVKELEKKENPLKSSPNERPASNRR